VADEVLPRPAPSVLYSDDEDLGPDGMLLMGEFGSDLDHDAETMRRLVLRYRGFQAELRPRELERIGAKLTQLRDLLTNAYRLAVEIDGDLLDLKEERREALELDTDEAER
jgi:hypothetical protein